MIFFFPKLSSRDFYYFRLGGAGMGNLLFPWARSVVYQKKYSGSSIIEPTWPQLKIGPLIRGEIDNRMYFGLFKLNHYKKGLLKWKAIFSKDIIDEAEFNSNPDYFLNSADDIIVVVEGLKDYFCSLKNNENLIKTELLDILKDPFTTSDNEEFIGVHIRLGDFKNTKQNIKLDWYQEVIEIIRRENYNSFKVKLFTDGTREEVKHLLEIGNVEMVTPLNAIHDILLLSEASHIIGTANSTFSLWAAFLGKAESYWKTTNKLDISMFSSKVHIIN